MCGEFVLVFAAGWMDGKVAFVFGFNQFNVLVLDVYDCWLLIFSKKVVLFFILHSTEGLNRSVIKIDWAEISVAFVSIFEMFF